MRKSNASFVLLSLIIFFLLGWTYFYIATSETVWMIKVTWMTYLSVIKMPLSRKKFASFLSFDLFLLSEALWNLMTISPLFLSYDQIMKETRKTVVPKVIVATPKVKEQDLVSRTREGITTKREQVEITQEKVNTDIWDGETVIFKLISSKPLTMMWYELLISLFLFESQTKTKVGNVWLLTINFICTFDFHQSVTFVIHFIHHYSLHEH